MRKLFILFWFIASQVYGQLSWNFETNNLEGWEQSKPGRWEVSLQEPISGTYSLHHAYDNSLSDHDQISCSIFDLRLDQGISTWQFKIKHSYQPSSSNNWAIHLISDKSATEMYPGSLINGFIIGVNYSGSDDVLKLWKSTDGDLTEIIATSINWQMDVPVDSIAAIKISRNQTGQWKVFLSSNGTFADFVEVGMGQSDEIIYPGYFGIYYEYSSTQDRKFWFDDLTISGVFIKDTIPPNVEEIGIKSMNELELYFNEPVSEIALLDTLNYQVDNSIGYPYSVFKIDDKSVHLKFWNEFVNETTYNIQITNISDLSGNQLSDPLKKEFFYYEVKPNTIVINEIMADPDPPIGLPEVEYIELQNNNNYEVCLDNWTLTIGTKEKEIPGICIPGGGYLIICSTTDTSIFNSFGLVAGIEDMPTLTNTGQNLIISDTAKQVISFVSYNKDWYHNEFKMEGGWSLEQIDPSFPCLGVANWEASTDRKGGTPGQLNSINNSNPDLIPPEVWKAFVVEDTIVELHFNEPYDREIAIQNSIYSIDKSFDSPIEVRTLRPDFTRVQLSYNKTFQEGEIYTLQIEDKFIDCSGNIIGNRNFVEFGIPEIIDSLDLVINEVLFNPTGQGVDFVEIFNRSDKILDVGDLIIATRDNDTWQLTSLCDVSQSTHLILPKGYLVLTVDPQKVITQYSASDPNSFVQLNAMPSFPNSEGIIVLLDKWFNIVDEFSYNEKMHFSLLRDLEGVSLERLNPDSPTMNATNWHSAAETIGYATPGALNSQFSNDSESNKVIWIEPEVFSPDNDGYEDFVQVFYDFGEPGYIANVMVFDAQGRRVRHLYNNELLGTSGSFIWDGENDGGEKANIGIYVFFIEVFNIKGEVTGYKKSCVLARKLN